MMRIVQDCRGGIIIWIFIMVAIFAALSYAVSSSMRVNSATSMTKEKMALYNVQVLSFLQDLKTQTSLLVKINKVAETSLGFDNDITILGNSTPNCWQDNPSCSTSSCKVFQPDNPKGAIPRNFPEIGYKVQQTSGARMLNGHGQPAVISVDGVGSSAPELIYKIVGIDPDFCNYYNSQQGLTTAFTTATSMATIGETVASSTPNNYAGCGVPGSFTAGKTIGEEATMFRGKTTFCTPLDNTSFDHRLQIVYVLLAR